MSYTISYNHDPVHLNHSALRDLKKSCEAAMQHLAEQAVIESIFETARALAQMAIEEGRAHNERMKKAWRERILAQLTPRDPITKDELLARIAEYRRD